MFKVLIRRSCAQAPVSAGLYSQKGFTFFLILSDSFDLHFPILIMSRDTLQAYARKHAVCGLHEWDEARLLAVSEGVVGL